MVLGQLLADVNKLQPCRVIRIWTESERISALVENVEVKIWRKMGGCKADNIGNVLSIILVLSMYRGGRIRGAQSVQ